MFAYHPEKINKVIIKLSGEFLAGEKGFGFDEALIDRITNDIIEVKKLGYSVGIVLGGGNIFRGGTWSNAKMSRCTLDNIGMMATIQNALYLSEVLRIKNYGTEVMSAVKAEKFVKFYTPRRALQSMKEGKIVFLCGGTGNPFFTTDTAVVLRAAELQADLVLKGTKVPGVFTKDPVKYSDAEFIQEITFTDAISQQLMIMDMTAFSLAKENDISIKVFDLSVPGNLARAIHERSVGTFISNDLS
ncbi:MAG: UMP kinase [Candidatus Cloacimonetes bacterium 4572_65]|nr:MAG: UMP kinase [Candidatus Cloacimonetes bacterium 4572_65]